MLTEKQIKFCEYYLATSMGAAAVRAAGYNFKNPAGYSSKLLKNEKILAYLEAAKKMGVGDDENHCQLASSGKTSFSKAGLTAEILEFYMDLMRGGLRCKGEVKISERLKAAEALGRILKISEEKPSGETTIKIKIVDDIL